MYLPEMHVITFLLFSLLYCFWRKPRLTIMKKIAYIHTYPLLPYIPFHSYHSKFRLFFSYNLVPKGICPCYFCANGLQIHRLLLYKLFTFLQDSLHCKGLSPLYNNTHVNEVYVNHCHFTFCLQGQSWSPSGLFITEHLDGWRTSGFSLNSWFSWTLPRIFH